MASAVGFSRNISLTPKNASNNSSSQRYGCSGGPSEPDSSVVVTVKTVTLCAIMLAALVGNAGVILVVIRTKTLRKTINFLIVNMAVADCLLATLAIPKDLIPLVTGSHKWRVPGDVGLAICKGLMILIDTASVVSILSMVCLAVDRFCAVVLPMKRYLITSTTRVTAIILTWVLALGYSSPYLYTLKMITLEGSSYCILRWGPTFEHSADATTIQVAIAVSIFGILPWILVAVLYTSMIVEIKKSKKASQCRRHTSRQKGEHDVRVTKLSLAIVLAFAVCNFPIYSMYLVVAVVWKWNLVCQPSYWRSLWFSAQTLVFLYTVLNPFICFTFSENFWKAFKDMLWFGRQESLTDRLSLNSRNRTSKMTYADNQNHSELSENSPMRRDLNRK